VRDHLSQVFDKTGARNQAGLVALLRGFAERFR
jgi:DNA-binding CsgD family transcriptional regulator